MGKARTGLLALVLALILAAPAAGQGRAFADIQTVYDRATAAAAASRHDEAAAHFYEGLEALRAAGKGETPDAGMFAAGLADALAAKGDAPADDAYHLAATLLRNADDPIPFLSVARRFIDRLLAGGGEGEAVALAEAALSLTFGPDIPPLLKAEAIEMALGAYGTAGRDAEADQVLARAGSLAGDDPFVAYLRGLARAQVARDAQKDGCMVEAVAAPRQRDRGFPSCW